MPRRTRAGSQSTLASRTSSVTIVRRCTRAVAARSWSPGSRCPGRSSGERKTTSGAVSAPRAGTAQGRYAVRSVGERTSGCPVGGQVERGRGRDGRSCPLRMRVRHSRPPGGQHRHHRWSPAPETWSRCRACTPAEQPSSQAGSEPRRGRAGPAAQGPSTAPGAGAERLRGQPRHGLGVAISRLRMRPIGLPASP